MIAALLAGLVILDCSLAGFRAAAGRNGALDKRAYYNRAMVAGALAGALLVIAFGSVAWLSGMWTASIAAAHTLVWIYGAYATLILTAFAFYFAPIGCYRVLTSVIVFGPMTLLRRTVIVAGVVVVVAAGDHPAGVRVLAVLAGAAMFAVEPWLGRRYAGLWRRLLE